MLPNYLCGEIISIKSIFQLYPAKRKAKNGNLGHTAQAIANAASSQAMIPLTNRGRLAGRTSPPLRTYTGSFSHHKHHNSNTSRKDNFASTDIIFLIVFPCLFTIFNFCYWSSLYVWRYQDDDYTELATSVNDDQQPLNPENVMRT